LTESAISTAAQLFPTLGSATMKPFAPRWITPSMSQSISSRWRAQKSDMGTNKVCSFDLASFFFWFGFFIPPPRGVLDELQQILWCVLVQIVRDVPMFRHIDKAN